MAVLVNFITSKMMKKIYSLVLLGLLASTSMVCAMDADGNPIDDGAVVGGGSLVPQSRELVLGGASTDDEMGGREDSVHASPKKAPRRAESGDDEMTDEEKLAAALLAAANLGVDDEVKTGGTPKSTSGDDAVEEEEVSDFDRLNALVIGLDAEGNITTESNVTSGALRVLLTALGALDSAAKHDGCSLEALAAGLQAKTTPAEQLEFLHSLRDAHLALPAVSATVATTGGDDADHDTDKESDEEGEGSEDDADATGTGGSKSPLKDVTNLGVTPSGS